MTGTDLHNDPRWQKLAARGGLITLPFDAPDGWPHGPLPKGERALEVGDDRLSPAYCTMQGHRFMRALLLLPITEARTAFGFETWASVSEESWQGWLSARAGGKPFAGCFAWAANALPGFASGEPVACNLMPGPAGELPRLQPQPGSALHEAQRDGISPARLAEIHAAAGADFAALLDA